MKVQLVTPYRVSHLHRYGVTVHGNVTSVYPTLTVYLHNTRTCGIAHANTLYACFSSVLRVVRVLE
jgi:hypothetical protein